MSEFDPHDLPDFVTWSEGFQPPLSPRDYVAEHVSVTSAVLLAELFSPQFVLVQDCVLIEAHYNPENFQSWWSSTGGDRTSIENVMNHLHLWDVFEPEGEVEARGLQWLAERIAVSWVEHARRQFPDRDFDGHVTDDYGPTVVLTTVREK